MAQDTPYTDPARVTLFVNDDPDVCPAFGLLEVVGVDEEAGRLRCRRPSLSGRNGLLVNGPQPVAPGGEGQAALGLFVTAGWEEGGTGAGAPLPGESWGAEAGGWFLVKRYPGFKIAAAYDDEAERKAVVYRADTTLVEFVRVAEAGGSGSGGGGAPPDAGQPDTYASGLLEFFDPGADAWVAPDPPIPVWVRGLTDEAFPAELPGGGAVRVHANYAGFAFGRPVYVGGSAAVAGDGPGADEDCVTAAPACPEWFTAYHHLESWSVGRGQRVSPGQVLGRIKAYPAGAHSHFSLGDGSDFLKVDPVIVCGQTVDVSGWLPYPAEGVRNPQALPPLYTGVFSAPDLAYIESVFAPWLPGDAWKIYYGSIWHTQGEYYALDVFPAAADPLADPPDQTMRGQEVTLAVRAGAAVESVVVYAEQVSGEAGGIVIVKHRRACCPAPDAGSGGGSGGSGGSGGGVDLDDPTNPYHFNSTLDVLTGVCLTLPPVRGSGSGADGSGSGGSGSGTVTLYDGLTDGASQAIAEWVLRQVEAGEWDGTPFPLGARIASARLHLPIGTSYTRLDCRDGPARCTDLICLPPGRGSGADTGYCYALRLSTGERLDFAGYDPAGYATWVGVDSNWVLRWNESYEGGPAPGWELTYLGGPFAAPFTVWAPVEPDWTPGAESGLFASTGGPDLTVSCVGGAFDAPACAEVLLTTGNTLPFAGNDTFGRPFWHDGVFELYYDQSLGSFALEDFASAGDVLRVPADPAWEPGDGPEVFSAAPGSEGAEDVGVSCVGETPDCDPPDVPCGTKLELNTPQTYAYGVEKNLYFQAGAAGTYYLVISQYPANGDGYAIINRKEYCGGPFTDQHSEGDYRATANGTPFNLPGCMIMTLTECEIVPLGTYTSYEGNPGSPTQYTVEVRTSPACTPVTIL